MPTADEVRAYMESLPDIFLPEKAEGLDVVIQLDLSGDNGGQWVITVADSQCEVEAGTADSPTMTLLATADDLYSALTGETNTVTAFMQGKIKVQGDMGLAIKMQTMFDFG